MSTIVKNKKKVKQKNETFNTHKQVPNRQWLSVKYHPQQFVNVS